MPTTSTQEWTKIEISWDSSNERDWHKYRLIHYRKKPFAEMRAYPLHISAKRRHFPLQAEPESCPYCSGLSPFREKHRQLALRQRFTQLAATWKQDTAHLSNTPEKQCTLPINGLLAWVRS